VRAEQHRVSLTVNGEPRTLLVPAHRTLLRALRDELDLTGTKECCTEGECGACTVLIDGKAVVSCLVLAVEAEGREVTTVEGLAGDDRLDPLQQAFIDSGAVQCGFCIPGMIMAAKFLLATSPQPTRAEVVETVSGNLCRCGGYIRIVDAVLAAAGSSS
jgi:carbon-monoxide dehydrogenase small subunit